MANMASEAKRLLNAKKGLENFDSDSLSLAVPFLVELVAKLVMRNDDPVLQGLMTEDFRKKVDHHNSLLAWKTWYLPETRFNFWPCLFAVLDVLKFIIIALRFGASFITLMGLPFFMIFFLFRGNKVVMAEPQGQSWSELCDMYNSQRMVLDIPCSVTSKGKLYGLETDFDPTGFQKHPSGVVRVVRGSPQRLWPPREALNLVGVGFTCVMPTVFAASSHNLEVAILTRGLGISKHCDESAWNMVEGLMQNELVLVSVDGHVEADMAFHSHDPYPVLTELEYINRFEPSKRKILLKTRDKINSGAFKPSQLVYNAFIKKEKMCKITRHSYEAFRPRLIQGLSKFAKVLAGPWFMSYSNAIKQAWDIDNWIWYSSGATAEDHDKWFADSLHMLGEVVFVYTDFSKYDMTQGERCIQGEIAQIRSLEPPFAYADEVLAAMSHSRVFTSSYADTVFEFSVPGTRKSGDLNTSSGNSRTTGFVMGSYVKSLGLRNSTRMVVLGDDNLMIIRHSDINMSMGEFCLGLKAWAERLGFILKVGFTFNPVEAEYVSGRFYPTADGYRFGKKPGRTLAKIGYFLHKNDTTDYLPYLKGTLISLLSTSNHVPFLRVYVNTILNHLRGITGKRPDRERFKVVGQQLSEVNEDTWAAFSSLYGLGEADENVFRLELEDQIAKYGVSSMMVSHHVEHLFECDFLL